MKMQRYELEAWLGEALADMTPEQVDAMAAAAHQITDRYPDTDEATEAMNLACQTILGETTVEEAAQRWHSARQAERVAMAGLTGAILASPRSELDLAAATGINRGTIRKARGK